MLCGMVVATSRYRYRRFTVNGGGVSRGRRARAHPERTIIHTREHTPNEHGGAARMTSTKFGTGRWTLRRRRRSTAVGPRRRRAKTTVKSCYPLARLAASSGNAPASSPSPWPAPRHPKAAGSTPHFMVRRARA